MKITKHIKNHLLNREEVQFVLNSESTPSMVITTETVAKHFNASNDVIAVKTIKNKFGSRDFHVHAFVYKSAADKDKVEIKPKVKKGAAS